MKQIVLEYLKANPNSNAEDIHQAGICGDMTANQISGLLIELAERDHVACGTGHRDGFYPRHKCYAAYRFDETGTYIQGCYGFEGAL